MRSFITRNYFGFLQTTRDGDRKHMAKFNLTLPVDRGVTHLMIGPENVGWRSVMSSSSSSKQVLVCCRVAIRVRTGMVTGVTCVTLVTGETWVILGGVCIGFPCREGQVFVRRKGEKKKKGLSQLNLQLLQGFVN